jgi:hypothetical protein
MGLTSASIESTSGPRQAGISEQDCASFKLKLTIPGAGGSPFEITEVLGKGLYPRRTQIRLLVGDDSHFFEECGTWLTMML